MTSVTATARDFRHFQNVSAEAKLDASRDEKESRRETESAIRSTLADDLFRRADAGVRRHRADGGDVERGARDVRSDNSPPHQRGRTRRNAADGDFQCREFPRNALQGARLRS